MLQYGKCCQRKCRKLLQKLEGRENNMEKLGEYPTEYLKDNVKRNLAIHQQFVVVNPAKRIVVYVIVTNWGIKFVGKAKCTPDDEWQENIGKDIARCRAHLKYQEWRQDQTSNIWENLDDWTADICNKSIDKQIELRKMLDNLIKT